MITAAAFDAAETAARVEVEAIAGAFTRALLIDRSALAAARDQNDVMGAFLALRRGYNVDVAPILAMARIEANGAADPIAMSATFSPSSSEWPGLTG